MSTIAAGYGGNFLSGFGSSSADEIGKGIQRKTAEVITNIKGDNSEWSWIFNDLNALALESGLSVANSAVLSLAQRFLLALPGSAKTPELALDDDGEVIFDWLGAHGEMLSLSLREDGQLAYAARFTSYDKEHGIKYFSETIPESVIRLVQKINCN